MTTKLTLTVDKETIDKAKKYAKEHDRSLSSIVENYLKSLSSKERKNNKNEYPIVSSMLGRLRLPGDVSVDYKKELTEMRDERLKRKNGDIS
ncbi:MAG: DUF6364 family protein [Ekhidna sp.]|uniref:DUF6364 family protein n=1 Tax=Ekhidna sp. TaxID=2608089 RepID=UPI0032EF5A9E